VAHLKPEPNISLSTVLNHEDRFHAHAFPAEFFEELYRLYPDIIELKRDSDGRLVALWANTLLPCWDAASAP
jgi:hypothetical protein